MQERERRRPRLRRAPSLPEVFPGQNERADGIEIAHEAQGTELADASPGPSFLDAGTITLRPSDPEDVSS